VQVTFADGSSTELVEVEFPLGHPRRRDEAVPRLRAKLLENLAAAYGDDRAVELAALLLDDPRLDAMRVGELLVALAR
jgi:2-methylcitrate dehydratase